MGVREREREREMERDRLGAAVVPLHTMLREAMLEGRFDLVRAVPWNDGFPDTFSAADCGELCGRECRAQAVALIARGGTPEEVTRLVRQLAAGGHHRLADEARAHLRVRREGPALHPEDALFRLPHYAAAPFPPALEALLSEGIKPSARLSFLPFFLSLCLLACFASARPGRKAVIQRKKKTVTGRKRGEYI